MVNPPPNSTRVVPLWERGGRAGGRTARPPRSWPDRLIWWGAWGLAGLIVAAIVAMRLVGEAWWLTTAITFGPRWLALVPVVVWAFPALIFSRRALIPLGLAALCAIGPLMGFCIPFPSLADDDYGGLTLRVVTLNPGGGDDMAEFERFVRQVDPDVMAFQEWSDPQSFLRAYGPEWNVAGQGELLIASRFPIVNAVAAPRAKGKSAPASFRADLQTPRGIVHVYCLHLATLRDGLTAVILGWGAGNSELERIVAIRNEESEIAARFAGEAEGPAIVLGDFNTPCESPAFRRDWSSWNDAFSTAGFGFGYTFASSRIGLRIDHILADRTHWSIRSCQVGPDLHGQHRPLAAELLLRRTGGTEPLADVSPSP